MANRRSIESNASLTGGSHTKQPSDAIDPNTLTARNIPQPQTGPNGKSPDKADSNQSIPPPIPRTMDCSISQNMAVLSQFHR